MHKQRFTLVSFLRAEMKPAPSPLERFLVSHVHSCTQQHCLVRSCGELKQKLAHFNSCEKATCMACASARLTWLNARLLLPSAFVKHFAEVQTLLFAHAIAQPPTAEYANKRTEFMNILISLYAVWEVHRYHHVHVHAQRAFNTHILLPPDQFSPLCQAVQRSWEQTVLLLLPRKRHKLQQ